MGCQDVIEAIRVAERVLPPVGELASSERLTESLQHALYMFYCRAEPARTPPSFDMAAVIGLVARCSAANHGTGTRDPGWRFLRAEHDGRCVVEKHRIVITASRGSFWLEQDGYGRLAIDKEQRFLVPGFYLALGNADARSHGAVSPPLARYYWNVASADAAVCMIDNLTTSLNAGAIPFRLKVPNQPDGFARADSVVLYVEQEWFERVRPMVGDAYTALGHRLRPETPRFAKQLAPGLAVAEDPSTGESFGQHRCRVLAGALVTVHERGVTDTGERMAMIANALLGGGIDPERPHLSARSTNEYRL